MANISPAERAAAVLECCLRGEPPPAEEWRSLLEEAAGEGEPAAAASQALFRELAEGLSDRFEPALCDVYAALFSEVVNRVHSDLQAAALRARYDRVRRARHFSGQPPAKVFVLSRVTLGADVAITSVLLDAARKRFPQAEIYFVGSRKAAELFAGDPRIRHIAADYRKNGDLRSRVEHGLALREWLTEPDSIVIDPDSRLTQLGLLPVCPEENYYFFESRSYGRDGDESLGTLTRRWAAETFGVVDALPFLAPPPGSAGPAGITVSFGVGDNPAKSLAPEFEAALLKELARFGLPLLVDKGLGAGEQARATQAITASGVPSDRIETWDGSFAPFAARIARSRLYVGYDSAGQHVAAAAKIPLLSIFAGYPCARFLHRWRPSSVAPACVLAAGNSPWRAVLEESLRAAEALLKVA